jgi:hypothetical protein
MSFIYDFYVIYLPSRSQWPHCLRHELSSPALSRIVGSNLTQGMDVCVSLFFVLLCV